jgi:NADH-quinone oxidoreductase subunit J
VLIQALCFYLFSAILIASAAMVIAARNPVHSVLFLILGFFNAAGLFVLMGAEFLAMILVVVYVGAVAVLFLFVVMMLDVDFAALRSGFLRHLPIGGTIGLILLGELALIVSAWSFAPEAASAAQLPIPDTRQMTNTHALGLVLYTDYIYAFQVAGVILLVAMVGAIVLTLREREGVRRQDVGRQINRTREQSIEVVKVPTRGGA